MEHIIFKTVQEAKEALNNDKLGAIYYKVGSVFVITNIGFGKFSIKEWRQGAVTSGDLK